MATTAAVVEKHHLHQKYALQRTRVRDVLEGSDQVKLKGVAYLPKLIGQTDTEYDAYKLRATFFNIASRVYGANCGMITRRSPIVNFPEGMSEYTKDTPGFTSFYELFNGVIKELLAIGSCGVFIDIKNDKPVPVIFKADNILNWDYDEDGELIFIQLCETKFEKGTTEVEYVYELFIDEQNHFSVKTFKNGLDEGVIVPNLRGRVLEFIPFIGGNGIGLSIDPCKSPILDIVDMNLSHYRTSADYEHGLHYVALPTPVITGATLEGSLKLGSSEGIQLPNKDAKAFYLEFQGQGLDSLAKALATKQSQISLFSARLQDTNTKGSEAENTVKLRYSADSASLASIAFVAELVLQETYSYIALWLGTEAPTITLNKDFISTKLSSTEFRELAKAFVDGALDEETYVYNLERGEMSIPGKKMTLVKPVAEEEEGSTGTED